MLDVPSSDPRWAVQMIGRESSGMTPSDHQFLSAINQDLFNWTRLDAFSTPVMTQRYVTASDIHQGIPVLSGRPEIYTFRLVRISFVNQFVARVVRAT